MTTDRKYSIAIQAYGDEGSNALPKISAVMQTDEHGAPHIIELTVGASDGGPIPSTAARNIDFQMLADALNGAVSATLRSSEDGEDPAASATGPVAPTERSAAPSRSAAPRPDAPTERPYRRMPDAKEVTEVLERTGSVGKLAQHYSVPRYTAQAWVDRLRRTGQLAASNASPPPG